MDKIQVDISSDIHFLENEKFDFDLPFSPTLPETKTDKNEDDDEVFFGPIGFTEQCMSTQVTHLQKDMTIKPLSPLSGEQVVEVFTEATKIALHFERLSTRTSDSSLNQSHASSGKNSLSNSFLKHSNCSSSSSSVFQFSFEKLSSGSSDDKTASQSDILDMDKENAQPRPMQGTKRSEGEKNEKGSSKVEATLVSKQNNTPIVKSKRSLPRPGSRGSRLPKSKNTEKSCSAFNSPIKEPDMAKTNNSQTRKLVQRKTQSIGKNARRRSENNVQKSVPSKATLNTTNARKTSLTTLAKRNIFRSTESLTEDGTKETKSCKLPVPEQSKIPGPRPRRRRSSSSSSISSQSSTSSPKSQPALKESQSISTSKTKPVPASKVILASSLPLGLIRRSKTQESCNDKKTEPMKALARFDATNKTSDTREQTSSQAPRTTVSLSSDETKNDKVPLPPTSQLQTSLPVARGRSIIRRPSLSSTRFSDGRSPQRNSSSSTTNCQTPRRNTEQTKKKESLACARRRSFIPTPGRNIQTNNTRTSRNTSDNPQLLSFSPAVNIKKNPSQESVRAEKVNECDVSHNEINTGVISSAQSIDDLLQLDDAVTMVSDVILLQPNPVPQVDLIDLSGI